MTSAYLTHKHALRAAIAEAQITGYRRAVYKIRRNGYRFWVVEPLPILLGGQLRARTSTLPVQQPAPSRG